jgi:hypothetical protein
MFVDRSESCLRGHQPRRLQSRRFALYVGDFLRRKKVERFVFTDKVREDLI